MNTILCFFQKCGAALLFGVIYLFQELLIVVLEIGKWLVTRGNQLSDEIEKVLVQLKGVLAKECPPFSWPVIPVSVIALLSTLLFIFLLSLLTVPAIHPASLDLSWLAWLFVLLATVLVLIVIVYALRHILPWIAGVLAVLCLLSLLAAAPSCSVPAGSSDEDTEYCWFWQSCYWKGFSIHWSTFHFPSYCWFWEDCYPHDPVSASSSGPVKRNVAQASSIVEYCWFWQDCFWQQLFGKSVVVAKQPVTTQPKKPTEEKVPQPKVTEYIIQNGDTLWKLSGGDPVKVDAIAHLNAGILDPYWLKNCSVIHTKTGKWCNAPKHTLQIGMRIFIPIAK